MPGRHYDLRTARHARPGRPASRRPA